MLRNLLLSDRKGDRSCEKRGRHLADKSVNKTTGMTTPSIDNENYFSLDYQNISHQQEQSFPGPHSSAVSG